MGRYTNTISIHHACFLCVPVWSRHRCCMAAQWLAWSFAAWAQPHLQLVDLTRITFGSKVHDYHGLVRIPVLYDRHIHPAWWFSLSAGRWSYPHHGLDKRQPLFSIIARSGSQTATVPVCWDLVPGDWPIASSD